MSVTLPRSRHSDEAKVRRRLSAKRQGSRAPRVLTCDTGGNRPSVAEWSAMTAGTAGTATERNEPELIARILAGERGLYHDLIRPYERMLYLTALAIVKNETDAEDGA